MTYYYPHFIDRLSKTQPWLNYEPKFVQENCLIQLLPRDHRRHEWNLPKDPNKCYVLKQITGPLIKGSGLRNSLKIDCSLLCKPGYGLHYFPRPFRYYKEIGATRILASQMASLNQGESQI